MTLAILDMVYVKLSYSTSLETDRCRKQNVTYGLSKTKHTARPALPLPPSPPVLRISPSAELSIGAR